MGNINSYAADQTVEELREASRSLQNGIKRGQALIGRSNTLVMDIGFLAEMFCRAAPEVAFNAAMKAFDETSESDEATLSVLRARFKKVREESSDFRKTIGTA